MLLTRCPHTWHQVTFTLTCWILAVGLQASGPVGFVDVSPTAADETPAPTPAPPPPPTPTPIPPPAAAADPTDTAEVVKEIKPATAEVDGTREAMKDPEDPPTEQPTTRIGKGGEDKNDEIVGPGESRRIAADETVEDLVVTLGKATVDGRVLGDLVVAGGQVTVNGTVDGSIACLGCRLILGSNAVVRGDVGGFGRLEKRRGALILGKEAFKKGLTLRDAIKQTPKEWIDQLSPEARLFVTDHVFRGRPLSLQLIWPWAILMVIGAVHVLALLLFPGPIARTARLMSERPVTTLLLGFVSLPLFLILTVVISAVTGCLGTPFVILALLLGLVVGKVAVELAVGGGLLSAFNGPRDPGIGRWEAGSPESQTIWAAFGLGALLLIIGYLVPFVGFGLWALATLWGLGAALLFVFSRQRTDASTTITAAGDATLNPSFPTSFRSPSVSGATTQPSVVIVPSPTELVPEAGPLTLMSVAEPAPVATPATSASTESFEAPVPPVPLAAVGVTAAASEVPAAPPSLPPGPPPTGPTGPTPLPPGASALERELWALPRAGLGVRLLALLIDLLVYGMFIAVMPQWFEWIPFFKAVTLVLYFSGFWVWKGATIGGLLLGIRVIRLDGRPIDWQVAVVRSLASFLSLFSAGLGQFWCAWDVDQQTWQDKLAGTVVVKEERRRTLI